MSHISRFVALIYLRKRDGLDMVDDKGAIQDEASNDVTSEMVEAGVGVIESYGAVYPNGYLVKCVYTAMERERRKTLSGRDDHRVTDQRGIA